MYKNILQSIDNIAIWPVVSFVIFFAFFIGLLWWVFSVDKTFIAKMKQLPIDSEGVNKTQKSSHELKGK
jgi:cytochrome c oxidase cbb3-type subunit 4